jgi:hypothetical protein
MSYRSPERALPSRLRALPPPMRRSPSQSHHTPSIPPHRSGITRRQNPSHTRPRDKLTEPTRPLRGSDTTMPAEATSRIRSILPRSSTTTSTTQPATARARQAARHLRLRLPRQAARPPTANRQRYAPAPALPDRAPRQYPSLGPTPKQLAGAWGGGVDERGLMEAAIAGSSHPLVKERYQSTKRRLGRQRGAKVAQIGSQKADGGDLVHADPQTNRFSPSLRRVPFSP